MDLQKLFDTMSEMQRNTRSDYHLTLGALIASLKKMPETMPVKFPDGTSPGRFMSYRGYYADLSLTPEADTPPTVAQLLQHAKAALGQEYTGYKGGEFRMGEDTPLWKAKYGNVGDAIIAITEAGGEALLITKQVDD